MKLPITVDVTDDHDPILLDASGDIFGLISAEGQAAYIANAVNTHARLVEALEEVDSWDWEGLRANPWHVDWRSALEDIKRAGEALAAAKGDSHD